MRRRAPGIRLPLEPTIRDPLAPDARVELFAIGRRLVVPVGQVPIGPGPHETLRAHLLVDVLPDRVRRRLHLRALRGAIVVDVATLGDLIELLEAARERASAFRRAA